MSLLDVAAIPTIKFDFVYFVLLLVTGTPSASRLILAFNQFCCKRETLLNQGKTVPITPYTFFLSSFVLCSLNKKIEEKCLRHNKFLQTRDFQ